MKNVTIALDDATHRQARIRAAELGTSLSALVKDYLNGLAAGDAPAASTGVREMQMPFKPAAPAQDGPPWLINGEWSYTRDGKPRQPGSLRKPGKVTDLPEWDQEMLDFFEELYTKPWNDDDFDPMP